MAVNWEKIRETEFPALKKSVYLKAAGGSPMCRSAHAAASAYLDEMFRDGDLHYKRYMDELDDLRAAIAGYIGASEDEIAFTVNASSGANIAAAMLSRAGVKTVFCPRLDFPATTHAVRNAGFRTVALGPAQGVQDGTWLQELARRVVKNGTGNATRAAQAGNPKYVPIPRQAAARYDLEPGLGVGHGPQRGAETRWKGVSGGGASPAHSKSQAQRQKDKASKAAVVGAHVCYLNGDTIDLGAAGGICRRHGMLLCVNATQSFGALDIDVGHGIDLLFASGLKWACAGYGSGFVFVRKELVEAHGLPPMTGWLSVADPYRMDPENSRPIPRARSLDTGGGFPAFSGLLALRGSLLLVKRIGGGDLRRGVRLIEERVVSLAERLRRGLCDAGLSVFGPGGPSRSGIVSIRDERAPQLQKGLEKASILTAVRADPEDGRPRILRFAVHYYNNEADADAAISAMRDLV